MFGKKEVAVSAEENITNTEVSLSHKDRVVAGLIGSGIALGIPGLAFAFTAETIMESFATNPGYTAVIFSIMTALTSSGGVFFNKMLKAEAMDVQIASAFSPDKESNFLRVVNVRKKKSELEKTQAERILVDSFHVKHTAELDVSTWQYAECKVAEGSATHIINHYLVRNKGTYRIEQEAIANNETIWDLSADALVEVYGVQEKTESMKEITA